MFSSPIEFAITSIGAGLLTEIFIAVLVVVFGMAVVWKRGNQHHGFTQYAPTLMTTLGILGTFTGIVAGLLDFDVKNIDGSIESLLAGMKTAFLTSLVGMLLALIYKVLITIGWLSVKDDSVIDEDSIGIAELYGVMKDQRDGIVSLKEAIGSGDESSLTGQMKLLRSDTNDNFKQHQKSFEEFESRLWIKLQDFADMLSKSATEQVIEALKQVIVDFNNNLTEQFGENFKQLNEAVFKLVEWQEKYKEQIAQMVEQYAQGVTAIGQTEASVNAIASDTQKIPESLAVLRNVLEVNQHQIEELDRHLESFAQMRDKAVEAVPQIQEQIDATLKGVTEASTQISSGLQEAGEKLQSAIVQGAQEFVDNSARVNQSLQGSSDVIAKNSEEVKQQFSDLVTELNSNFRNLMAEITTQNGELGKQFKEAGKKLTSELGNAQREFQANLERMAEKQSDEAQRVFTSLRKSVEDALSDTKDALTKQVGVLDSQLESELSRVMSEMGRALASISGQFTTDYEKLVRAMRAVTNT
ncbi:hypothetical protein A15D_00372 [Alcanivorax sp. MD8A]|uniref:MotA/TolQ/ExbB proton channel family protein n=1 Tax=Alcanivorax sp. MD8A TaxID=1177157 RepID=UPI000C9996D7|nr:MotA/TolQ/ExbB proton channel family protein [Alcanivorax sp. MD8A]PNE04192.1 hypothetical protein A15D_00372 [Alcanivorax sp. MD8A]